MENQDLSNHPLIIAESFPPFRSHELERSAQERGLRKSRPGIGQRMSGKALELVQVRAKAYSGTKYRGRKLPVPGGAKKMAEIATVRNAKRAEESSAGILLSVHRTR